MSADPWPAPVATVPVDATVEVPGSKSLTNRALVLAALAEQPTLVRRPLRARDTVLMARGLQSLGATLTERADGWWVQPAPPRAGATVDCGLAGTVMRFLPPVAALAVGPVRFDGDPRARERPLRPLVQALRDLGVTVDDGGRGALPIIVAGTGKVPGGEVTVDASGSSQFVSALLLAGCRYERGLLVRHAGGPLPSLPHIEMTVRMLRQAGVPARTEVPAQTGDGEGGGPAWRVAARPPRGGAYDIEPDLSNAAPFLAAALVTGGRVTVPGWPEDTTQPGDLLRGILAEMGATVRLERGACTVRGGRPIAGVDLDLGPAGELAPVLVAVAALATGPSRFRGIAHLRGHETDRLAALCRELTALGGDVAETPDGLAVRPRPLHGGRFATYADHRMAQAGAVLGLVVPGVLVDDVATTAKTLPDFPAMWAAMLSGAAA